MQTKLLVAIITCRRPQGLTRLVNALLKQRLSHSTAEILVVDNACQTEIASLINKISEEAPFKIHYQQEAEPGIVAARNNCTRWFLTGDYDALIFIDDDEWPAAEDWLEKLVEAQLKYQCDIVTSNVISVGESGTPNWATQLLYGENHLIEGQQVKIFYTNNLLLSRTVLEKFQPTFDSRFAMTGASDYHFALRCTQAGYKAYFTEAPVIEEFPKSRATLSWFLRRGFRSGIGYSRSHRFEESTIIALGRCLLMFLVRLGFGFIKCLQGALTLNKKVWIEGLFRFASAGGTIAGLFGIKHNEYKKIHGA
ncbi:glycosyltransferase family 2 protein [Alishewanella sp. HL-SH05]|uniref:glycosyltransferase family 2 protein n=1 Tax=Alishewanella sp. HL-SH05 TaxID=3461145 RepID=UPI004041760C